MERLSDANEDVLARRRRRRSETGFGTETEMRDYVLGHLGEIEAGLVPLGGDEHALEVRCKSRKMRGLDGQIDILAGGPFPEWVVIECKLGMARPSVLGQILGYMAWMHHNFLQMAPMRGIIVATRFSPGVQAAQSLYGLPVTLVECSREWKFSRVD